MEISECYLPLPLCKDGDAQYETAATCPSVLVCGTVHAACIDPQRSQIPVHPPAKRTLSVQNLLCRKRLRFSTCLSCNDFCLPIQAFSSLTLVTILALS